MASDSFSISHVLGTLIIEMSNHIFRCTAFIINMDKKHEEKMNSK
jgi:hypothetical protein